MSPNNTGIQSLQFLQVTLNFELEYMNIIGRHCNSYFAHSFDFSCLTNIVKNIKLL